MAVFTEVSFDEAVELVSRLRIGDMTALVGIAPGIENTNYFVDTTGMLGAGRSLSGSRPSSCSTCTS